MPALTLVSHLGSYLDATALRLAEMLRSRTGIDIRFDPALPWADRRRAVGEGEADIAWMCGYLTRRLGAGGLEMDIKGAPVFAGEESAVYHGVIVAATGSGHRRLGELRGARLVINEFESWSGYQGLREHLARHGLPDPFFSDVIESGSHAASLEALRLGQADGACIDSTQWRTLRPDERSAYRVVDRTRDWPAPPFSLSPHLDPDLRRMLGEALAGLAGIDEQVRAVVATSESAYDEMAAWAQAAD